MSQIIMIELMGQSHVVLESGVNLPLKGLRGACRFYGGVRSVALKAGTKQSNLSHWLKGRHSMSEEKVAALLDVLDLPDGLPRQNRVLEWHYKVQWNDIGEALEMYFPLGAIFARAPWSRPGLSNLYKFLTVQQLGTNGPPEIFIIKSGETRAVIRQPPGFLLYEDMLGKKFRERKEGQNYGLFDIGEHKDIWFKGSVSREIFDEAFDSVHVSWEEAIQVAQEKNITVARVLDWMKSQ